MKHLLILATLLPFATACGGPAKTRKPGASPPTGGTLSAQLAQAAHDGPAHGDAMITLAVFLAGPPPEADAARKAAMSGVRAAHLSTEGLVVTPAPIDDALPLDLGALATAAGPQGAALAAARGVIFVRYAGRPAPDGAHLRAAGEAALAVAPADALVVDLSTRATWAPAALRAALGTPAWRADQVVPEATRADDGTVTFATRGMAKFGLPDLEQTGVAPEAARAAFERFTEVWRALRVHGPAAPGDTVAGALLRPCARGAEAYDLECVAF